MERLTHETSTKCSMSPWDWCGLDKDCKRDCFKPEPCKIPKIARRLAEYEDTGLMPKQITAMQAELAEYRKKAADGTLSDGYHTFNELYHHRAVLFSVICNQNQDKAWKSMEHDDGSMYGGMFIVGLETPDGQATYHYDTTTYWDLFDVKELDHAPKWDGHTPDEAIDRIANMGTDSVLNVELPCPLDKAISVYTDIINSMSKNDAREFKELTAFIDLVSEAALKGGDGE